MQTDNNEQIDVLKRLRFRKIQQKITFWANLMCVVGGLYLGFFKGKPIGIFMALFPLIFWILVELLTKDSKYVLAQKIERSIKYASNDSNLNDVGVYKGFDFKLFDKVPLASELRFLNTELLYIFIDLMMDNPENQKIMSEVMFVSESDRFDKTDSTVRNKYLEETLSPIFIATALKLVEMMRNSELTLKQYPIGLHYDVLSTSEREMLSKKMNADPEDIGRTVRFKSLSSIETLLRYFKENNLLGYTEDFTEALKNSFDDIETEGYASVQEIRKEMDKLNLQN